MSIEKILDLEQLEVNIYRGNVFSPDSGFFQRTFGHRARYLFANRANRRKEFGRNA